MLLCGIGAQRFFQKGVRMKKIIILAAALFIAVNGIYAQQKYALVIGNGKYDNFGSLRNAVNDANAIEITLKGLGFTVDKLINGNLDQMESAVSRLRGRLSASATAYGLFYYAGHGLEYNGENFLIPADANIRASSYLRNRALSVQAVLNELEKSGNYLNMIVLDACRNLPNFPERDIGRGLAVVNPPSNSIVLYATAAGETAADGEGVNGLFTTHLLNNLKTPGLEVTEMFRRTGRDVARASGNRQRPALYMSFYETAYFGGQTIVKPPEPELTKTKNLNIKSIAGKYKIDKEIITITGSDDQWTIIYFDNMELPLTFTLNYELRLNSGNVIVAEAMLNMNMKDHTYNRIYPYHFESLRKSHYYIGKGAWNIGGRGAGGPTLVSTEEGKNTAYPFNRLNIGEWYHVTIIRSSNGVILKINNEIVLNYKDTSNALNRNCSLGFLTNADMSIRNIDVK
jgi:hypothetical protein